MYEKIGQLFRTAPTITFHCDCYHWEERVEHYKDAEGHDQTRTNKVKITTHTDSFSMPYYSCKDVSGLFYLEADKAARNSKVFIKLHLKKEINFADPISYSDYMFHKEGFWQRNRYLDAYMDFNETRSIDGFHEYNLVQIGDYVPPDISAGRYLLFTFLMAVQFYKKKIDNLCVLQNYKIRKLVSTRYNLLLPDYSQQYASICPALNMNSQMMTYESNNTGYCYESANINVPSTKNLRKQTI